MGAVKQGRDWDLFCRVVDNYGDIGVCWRLARQLVAEYGQHMRLWVDDLASFAHICPALDPALDRQTVAGVEIRHWSAEPAIDAIGDVVIEAFACELPPAALTAMRARAIAPAWINLEYLSAESWVEGCHSLASPQAGGLTKYFYFPGFSAKTGGVLAERSMREARAAWSADDARRWLARLSPSLKALPDNAIRISLFAYENAAVASLFDAWAASRAPVICYLPEGRVLPQVSAWFGVTLTAGQTATRGALTLQVLPFISQEEYDRLLWSCDVNFVRGEDSFVRAQWAGKPLVWHIYRQEEDAHLAKLDAFLDRYLLGAADGHACRDLMHAWNREQPVGDAWQAFAADLPRWRHHAETWADYLDSLGNLAGNLVSFVNSLLK